MPCATRSIPDCAVCADGRAMKVYLVRHGESEGNARAVHQDAQAELSNRGRGEARALARRLRTVHADAIISSTYPRALQTAAAISAALKIPIVQSALFVELKRPTEIEGRPSDEPAVVAIKTRILDRWSEPLWHHSDEENFFELRSRAVEALEFLSGRSDASAVVVTHAVFMRMLVCVMAFGEALRPDNFRTLQAFLGSANSGITLCQYDRSGESDGATGWRLITWNDHAHLDQERPSGEE